MAHYLSFLWISETPWQIIETKKCKNIACSLLQQLTVPIAYSSFPMGFGST